MPVISLSNHPSNIAVFTAAAFHEARGKAQQHNDRPRIEASVWITSPNPVDWTKEEKLVSAFERVMRLQADPDKTTVVMRMRSGKNSFGLNREAPVPYEVLDHTRSRNLEVLGRTGNDVQLSVRRAMVGAEQGDNQYKDRIIHARQGAGAWTYDPAGRAWELAAGSYMFINNPTDTSALRPTSVSKFSVNARRCTVDVYDF